MKIFVILIFMLCSSLAFGEDKVIHTNSYYGGEVKEVGDLEKGLILGVIAGLMLGRTPIVVNKYPPASRNYDGYYGRSDCSPVVQRSRGYTIYEKGYGGYGCSNPGHRHYKSRGHHDRNHRGRNYQNNYGYTIGHYH